MLSRPQKVELVRQILFGKQKQASIFNDTISSVVYDTLEGAGCGNYIDLTSCDAEIQHYIMLEKRQSDPDFDRLQWIIGEQSCGELAQLGDAGTRLVVFKLSNDSPKINYRIVGNTETDATAFATGSKDYEIALPKISDKSDDRTLLQKAQEIEKKMCEIAPTAWALDPTVVDKPWYVAILALNAMLEGKG